MGDQREGQREILHLHPVNSGHSLWIPSFAVLESDGVDAGQSKKPGSFHTSILPLHGGLYLINSFHAFHGCFQVIKLTLESSSVTMVFLKIGMASFLMEIKRENPKVFHPNHGSRTEM